ncbi:(2Fe-2S)-binding protein [Marinobacter sp. NSM]|uniref:(2Fe-2S)-binding protein n=1 Tax=Marinobacter sp. NSM TaxID=3458004 RepID=UPI00403515B5
MAENWAESPLAESLAAVAREGGDDLSWLAPSPPGGYNSLAELPAARGRLDWLLTRLPEVWDSEDPRFGAAWLFEKTVEHTVSALAGCFVLHHRVPLAGPRDIWVNYDADGVCSAPGFSDPAFACLASDASADHQDAVVVETVEQLGQRLLAQLHDLYRPLAETLARPARRGLRTQLKVVADLAIVAVWWFAREFRGEAEGFRYAEMLGHGGPPLWGKAGFRDFPHRGRVFRHRIRNTCCLFYTRRENRYCFTCPLRSKENRNERWGEHFDAQMEAKP